VRRRVLASSANPWKYVDEMRNRVERERARPSRHLVALKTGRGGLMDVDFLAAGGVLEMRPDRFPSVPSVPAMLGSVAQGSQIAQLLDDHAFLRMVESRARLIAGRPVEDVRTDGNELALLTELVDPEIEPAALIETIRETQIRIRTAFESVIERGAISALSD